MTAYQMLYRTAKIKPGQTILVHGAGGAVGSALIQLGRLINLKMYGTAKKSKHNLVKSLGVIPIDYESEDFVEYIKGREVKGIDVVFDGIGGSYFKRSFSLLKSGGILVAYGFQKAAMGGGKIIDFVSSFINLKLMNMFSFKKTATFYAITTVKKKHPGWFKDDFKKLLELLQEKKIEPVISGKMPLTDAVKAHKILDQSAVEGKIILIVNKE
jgi:NADPH:quinone reductase-like Zn-dependent oxidoreductase